MPEKANEPINLFIRDKDSGRHMFNAKALHSLGIDPAKAGERGYPISQVLARGEAQARPRPNNENSV
jgi:hypothetical protein